MATSESTTTGTTTTNASVTSNSVPNWNHAYKMLIGRATDTSANASNNGAFVNTVNLDEKLGSTTKSSSDLILLTENQITFSIRKDNNKDANQAQITVYNLSDDTVNYINKNLRNNLAVALAVGFKDQTLEMIFKGTIQWVSDTFDGVNRKTDLHCVDGGLNISLARTSRSYSKGTKISKIVTDLVSDLGTTSGTISVDTDTAVSSAYVVSGNTSFHLEHICKSIDHNFSIQDGSVYVTPRTQRQSSQSAYISSDSGLIGSPQPFHNDVKPTAKATKANGTKKKPTDGVKFSCQINGSLLPEKTVWLKSNDYDEAFKVVTVTHQGDYEGGQWQTDIEAIAVPGIITVSSSGTKGTIK